MELERDGAGEDGYSGLARLMLGQDEFEVEVELRGHFEPIDGRYHWYGRIASNQALTDLVGGFRAVGLLDTGQGRSPCELTDPDLWNRYRISGTSTPPFRAMAPGPQDG